MLGMSKTDIQYLTKLQNQGLRVILGCSKRTKVTNMLQALSFMTIKERIEYNVCTLVYKIRNRLCPTYLSEQIKVGQSSYETRQRNNISLNRCKTSEEQKMLLYEGFKMYNNLPNEINSEQNLNKFKRLVVKYIKRREREKTVTNS